MFLRALRIFFRILGWLFSPLVILTTAFLGAMLGFAVAGHWAPVSVLTFAFATACAGALLGILGWMRLLRGSPRLREALAVTQTGLPESEVVHDILQAVSLEERSPQ